MRRLLFVALAALSVLCNACLALSQTHFGKFHAGDFDSYVLALSWQPAFCESNPGKAECQSQTVDRYDSKHLSLHGLWPNLDNDQGHIYGFCGVDVAIIKMDNDKKWCQMPELHLSEPLDKELAVVMPGKQSCLERHEWYKHGVCSGKSPDAYYLMTIELVKFFDNSDFGKLLSGSIGKKVKKSDLLRAFSDEFGEEAVNAVQLFCGKNRQTSMLSEIQIKLKKDLSPEDGFRDDLHVRPQSGQGKCPREFLIDKANGD